MLVREYNNFDIVDLAIKQKLIGVELKDKDGNYNMIVDYYLDFATNEIHLQFAGSDDAEVFTFRQKFTVRINDYKAIKKLRRKFANKF